MLMNPLFPLMVLMQLQQHFSFGWTLNIKQRNQIGLLISSSDSWNQHQNNGRGVNSLEDEEVISAAAAVTKETSPLLGLRSLGVDYGLARTGLAVTIGFAPSQLTIIEEVNSTLVIDQIIRYAKSEGASQIILGLPLHKNGTESEQTALTRIFGEKLARKALSVLGKVPVILWDERYTSKEAAARVHAQDPGRFLRGTLDAEAACIILENYYYDDGKGAEEILLDNEVRESCREEYQRYQAEIQREKNAVLEKRDANLLRRQEMLELSRNAQVQSMVNPGVSKPTKKKKKKK